MSVGLLPKLVSLELKGNKLTTPPKETIKGGPQAIRVFMRNMLLGSTDYYRMRLMFVGQENVFFLSPIHFLICSL